jgi:hypothetical protein
MHWGALLEGPAPETRTRSSQGRWNERWGRTQPQAPRPRPCACLPGRTIEAGSLGSCTQTRSSSGSLQQIHKCTGRRSKSRARGIFTTAPSPSRTWELRTRAKTEHRKLISKTPCTCSSTPANTCYSTPWRPPASLWASTTTQIALLSALSMPRRCTMRFLSTAIRLHPDPYTTVTPESTRGLRRALCSR